jgi:hypothetical protein
MSVANTRFLYCPVSHQSRKIRSHHFHCFK